jgi:hypothetical protein
MIPKVLSNYDTHLLEYMPGTYGDYICGIISHAVDEFIDPTESVFGDQKKYWNANSSIVSRNKYPLSLRGGGYEHVENYTELMLAHHVFIHYDTILNDTDYLGKSIMFNTHTYMPDSTKYRTISNKFTHTKSKCLTLDDNFDTMFMSACNEYFTSHSSYININWDVFCEMFVNRVVQIRTINNIIPKDKLFNIGDITKFNEDTISCYGTVDSEKFEAYAKEYNDRKFEHFMGITNRTYKVFFKNVPERLAKYIAIYDSIKPYNA